MASTTSAAASMLLSGSSTSSRPGSNPSAPATLTIADDLHGYNFDSSKWKQSVYFPNPNSFSSSAHPTVTLDLTSNPSLSSSSSSSSSSLFNKFSSSPNYAYPSTSLSFGSSESGTNMASWNNNGFLSYGATTHLPYTRNQTGNLSLGRVQTLQNNVVYQNYAQKNSATPPPPPPPSQLSLPSDPIAAATKAIAADPSFQSALAAALTSIMGGGAQCRQGGSDNNHNVVQKLKWPGSEQFPASSSATTLLQTVAKGNNNACGSTFLNKTASSSINPQAGNLLFSSPSLSFSTSKSASASPAGDTGEHTN